MKIIALKEIERKDVPIYYRRLFSGIVVLDIMDKEAERRIDFSIETKPTGHKEITVTFMEAVDYPLLPLMRKLKKYIDDLDNNGELPG
jgi:hypothetical protein